MTEPTMSETPHRLDELREQAQGGSSRAAMQALINGLEYELTAAQAEITRLEALFDAYGEHLNSCDQRYNDDSQCTCGYSAALAKQEGGK